MMKLTLALLAALVLAGTASAGTVDFSAIITPPKLTSCDATISHHVADAVAWTGCDVGGVRFWYDDFGTAAITGTAQIDASGIDIVPGTDPGGYIGGTLTMQLLGPVWGGVTFSFMVANPSSDPLAPDIIQLTLNNTAGDNGFFGVDTTGVGTASMTTYPGSFPTGPWSTASLSPILMNQANDFFISAASFDTASPEPATYVLLVTGLLLMGFGQRKLARRKS